MAPRLPQTPANEWLRLLAGKSSYGLEEGLGFGEACIMEPECIIMLECIADGLCDGFGDAFIMLA